MKKFSLIVLLMLVNVTSMWADRIKVACVGNSITYGAGIVNREKNSYPAQLQYYLGDKFEVRNFGHNGATALSNGDIPYTATAEYKASTDFQPDIVLIKLGTNDTKPHNWDKEKFVADYQSLIKTYQSLDSHPRIVLLTPVRCFLTQQNTISPAIIEQEVRPIVEDLAWKNGLDIVNLFNLYGDEWQEHIMPDRLHPSSIGAGFMAKKIGDYILRLFPESAQKEVTFSNVVANFNFHGFQEVDFNLGDVPCKVVRPKVAADGLPWVLRARFWGHEPQTDIDLLEHGFHIAYCDVADLYGADKAIKRWNHFYKWMVKHGFNEKVVLEGMSRGGLAVYNWAVRNPEKVACIYADAPVMDIKSWPLGEGSSDGSEPDSRQLFAAYGFKDKTEAAAWEKNPVNHARKLARAGIPILHVVGDDDRIVPFNENTGAFETQMSKYGSPITVIHKPGVGHHPHSLNNPEKIVNFILKSTGRLKNTCTHAVPGNEYRSGAGWKSGADWHAVEADIEQTLEGRQLKLMLLGNSITQGWGGNRELVTYKPGKAALDMAFGQGEWESCGISGDQTQSLLWRIRYGNYNKANPKAVVIAIGINNVIGGTNSADEIARGIVAVTDEAVRVFPDSRIILLGLFPAGKEKSSVIRKQCDRIHEILSGYRWNSRIQYHNPTSWLVDMHGTIRDGLYSGDYIHLTENGYKCVADKLKEIVSEVL